MTISMYHVGMFIGVMGLVIVPMWHLPVVKLKQVGFGEYAWLALGCFCTLMVGGTALRTQSVIGLLLFYYSPPVVLALGLLGLLWTAVSRPSESGTEVRDQNILSFGAIALSGLCMLVGAESSGFP
jgi:hypothetical protein